MALHPFVKSVGTRSALLAQNVWKQPAPDRKHCEERLDRLRRVGNTHEERLQTARDEPLETACTRSGTLAKTVQTQPAQDWEHLRRLSGNSILSFLEMTSFRPWASVLAKFSREISLSDYSFSRIHNRIRIDMLSLLRFTGEELPAYCVNSEHPGQSSSFPITYYIFLSVLVDSSKSACLLPVRCAKIRKKKK